MYNKESWKEIMRSCLAGAECESKASKGLKDSGVTVKDNKKCGLDAAYGYFVSFIFLSSFLVIIF